jgi:serine protease
VERVQGQQLRRGQRSGFIRLTLPPGVDVQEALRRLRLDAAVESAGPNAVMRALETPDDPYFVYQWNLRGSGEGGINATSAWDLAPSAGAGVVVAVLDTGVAFENATRASYHFDGAGACIARGNVSYARAPDLAGTSLVAGRDFVCTADGGDDSPNDDHAHGTHVAGTIAQTTNNAVGVAGVARGASIQPVKVLDTNGGGTLFDLNEAIKWAVDHGARVINMSLGFGPTATLTDLPGLADALEYAHAHRVVVVAAAGNGGTGILGYPAAYHTVIAVGATRFDRTRAPYSSYGGAPDASQNDGPGRALDVMAPGGHASVDQNGDGQPDGILQNTLNPINKNPLEFGYWFYQGTSMASPHVAGAAAVLLAQNPLWGPAEVRQALQSTALCLGGTCPNPNYGYGLIDLYAALGGMTPPSTPTITPTMTVTATAMPSLTSAVTPNGTSTATPTRTPSPTLTPSHSPTATNTPTASTAPSVAPTATTAPFAPIRVNSGGGTYVGAATWSAETGCSGGWNQTSAAPIASTADDPLYQSLRVGLSGCDYVVPNGSYDVTLKFAELSYSTVGKRRVDIYIEGQQVLNDLDVFARVGKNTALDCTFAVAVGDGLLNLSFARVADNPSVGAIEIVPSSGTAVGCGAVAATSTPTALPSPTATPTRTSTPTTPTPSSTPVGIGTTPTASPTATNAVAATATSAVSPTATRTSTPNLGPVVLASDTFECGTSWACGTGWAGPWETAGSAAIVTGGAHSVSRHTLLRAANGVAEREVPLNGATNVRWQLWVKINSFEAADIAVAQVSTDGGGSFATVHTWTRAASTNSYRFYDIDLSDYASHPQLLLRLQTSGNALDDYFYFDDVQVVAS